jgi:hypothetical protein
MVEKEPKPARLSIVLFHFLLNRRMACRLSVQILATTVFVGKSRQHYFCPKNPIIEPFQLKKNITNNLRTLP